MQRVLAHGFWTLCGLVAGLQIWLSMIEHRHSVARILVYQVLVWNGWLLLSHAVRRLVQRVPPVRGGLIVHAIAALVAGGVHLVYWTALLVAFDPYREMGSPPPFFNALKWLALSSMPLELLLYCGVVIAAIAAQRQLRALQLERSLAEARMHALELQLQPHFLFNTLNAVSALVRTARNDEAVEMIAGLSDLLRYTLDHAGQQRVSIEEETAILQRYLEIQRVRFADRLTFHIDVAGEARQAAVPTLILQPLAENAIRHGLARSAGRGRVDVRAFRDGERLRIEMFNTGSLDASPREGIGIRNTVDRLRQLYGDAHRFELRNAGDGVLAALEIPWSAA